MSEDQRTRRGFRPKLTGAVVLSAIVLGFGSLQAIHYFRHEAIRARWVAAGGELEWAAVDSLPVPADLNAAVAWEEAFKALPTGRGLSRFPESERETIDMPEFAAPAERAEVATRYATVTAGARRAAEYAKVHWPEPSDPYRPGRAPGGVPLDESRTTAQLLLLEAWVGLDRNDLDVVHANVAAALDLADDAASRPLLINGLLALQIDAYVLEFVEAAFRFRRMTDDPVWDRLVERDPRRRMRRVMLGDGTWTLSRDPRFKHAGSNHRQAVIDAYLMILAYLEQPYFTERERLQEAHHAAVAQRKSVDNDPIPTPSVPLQSAALSEARLQLYRLARQVRAYEARHGRLPQTEELSLPPEPVTGTVVSYAPIGEGFVVWNIAADYMQHLRHAWRWGTEEMGDGIPWWRNPHIFWDRAKDSVADEEPEHIEHQPHPKPRIPQR